MKTLTLVTMLAGVTVSGAAAAQGQPPPYEETPEYQGQDPYAQPQPVDPYDDSGEVGDDGSAYDEGYDPNAYSQFESTLSPYGDWYDDAAYGRVWFPSETV